MPRCAGWACGTKKSLRAAERDRPDVARQRRWWRGWQRYMDPVRFVFLDKTATTTNMARLPPYSPDLNPIEQLFAKLKALLRKAAARTREDLWQTIGRLLQACSPTECATYIRHCGYGST